MSGAIPESLYCRMCRGTVGIPKSVPREIVEFVTGDRLALTRAIQRHLGLDLREAKQLALHVPRDGNCHRCKAAVPAQAVTVCGDCRAVNVILALLP